jgi:hypothetical protein
MLRLFVCERERERRDGPKTSNQMILTEFPTDTPAPKTFLSLTETCGLSAGKTRLDSG